MHWNKERQWTQNLTWLLCYFLLTSTLLSTHLLMNTNSKSICQLVNICKDWAPQFFPLHYKTPQKSLIWSESHCQLRQFGNWTWKSMLNPRWVTPCPQLSSLYSANFGKDKINLSVFSLCQCIYYNFLKIFSLLSTFVNTNEH